MCVFCLFCVQDGGARKRAELVSGYGPFEFMDMCAEAGIEPIVTTTAQWGDEMGRPEGAPTCCSAEDMADLIEYSWVRAPSLPS